jgi:hypothetical protein
MHPKGNTMPTMAAMLGVFVAGVLFRDVIGWLFMRLAAPEPAPARTWGASERARLRAQRVLDQLAADEECEAMTPRPIHWSRN